MGATFMAHRTDLQPSEASHLNKRIRSITSPEKNNVCTHCMQHNQRKYKTMRGNKTADDKNTHITISGPMRPLTWTRAVTAVQQLVLAAMQTGSCAGLRSQDNALLLQE